MSHNSPNESLYISTKRTPFSSCLNHQSRPSSPFLYLSSRLSTFNRSTLLRPRKHLLATSVKTSSAFPRITIHCSSSFNNVVRTCDTPVTTGNKLRKPSTITSTDVHWQSSGCAVGTSMPDLSRPQHRAVAASCSSFYTTSGRPFSSTYIYRVMPLPLAP